MSNAYDIGDQVRLSAQFTDGEGFPADPTSVLLTIRDGNGAATVYTYGVDAIARESVGAYHFDLTLINAGSWVYRWEGTANPQTAQEGVLQVQASQIQTGASPLPNPCTLLQDLQAQQYKLAAGQAIRAVDTPQLGRVEYSQGDPVALQRVIDSLAVQCGATGTTAAKVRKPFSFFGWP
jgi:predicted Zn-dependent protease